MLDYKVGETYRLESDNAVDWVYNNTGAKPGDVLIITYVEGHNFRLMNPKNNKEASLAGNWNKHLRKVEVEYTLADLKVGDFFIDKRNPESIGIVLGSWAQAVEWFELKKKLRHTSKPELEIHPVEVEFNLFIEE